MRENDTKREAMLLGRTRRHPEDAPTGVHVHAHAHVHVHAHFTRRRLAGVSRLHSRPVLLE